MKQKYFGNLRAKNSNKTKTLLVASFNEDMFGVFLQEMFENVLFL
jgi:hypothetical protein